MRQNVSIRMLLLGFVTRCAFNGHGIFLRECLVVYTLFRYNVSSQCKATNAVFFLLSLQFITRRHQPWLLSLLTSLLHPVGPILVASLALLCGRRLLGSLPRLSFADALVPITLRCTFPGLSSRASLRLPRRAE